MKRTLMRHLAGLEAEELREEIETLYDRFDLVRAYYQLELSGNTNKAVDRYKKKIHSAFFRGRGKRGRSLSRDHIKAFRQISLFAEDELDLEIYRAEMMVEWMIARWSENLGYFASLEKAYEDVCKKAVAQQSWERFAPELARIAERFEGYRRRGGHSLWPYFRTAENQMG